MFLDLDAIPQASPEVLSGYRLLNIPSYGLPYIKLDMGVDHIVMSDQRMEGLSISSKSGLYVTYLPLPEVENSYRQDMFGSKRPAHISVLKHPLIDLKKKYAALVYRVRDDHQLIEKIKEFLQQNPDTVLMSYHASSMMETLATSLAIPFLGNSVFSQHIGSKIGLHQFLVENQLPHLDTFIVKTLFEYAVAVKTLREKGYSQAVLKSNHSSAGIGHTLLQIDTSDTNEYDLHIIEKQLTQDSCVLQGWIAPQHQKVLFSLDLLVTLDMECHLVHLKSKNNATGSPSARADYLPIREEEFALIEPYINILKEALLREKAVGHHSLNCVAVSEKGAEIYGLNSQLPYIHDENPRVGAARMSMGWLQALRGGCVGRGWVDRKIDVNPHISANEIWKRLEQHTLLVERTGKDTQGVFPYNSIYVENGIPKINLLSISASQDINHAQQMMDEAEQLLQG